MAKQKAPSQKKGLDIGGALTRKLGPLPAWLWLAIAGVGIYLYERNKSAAAATPAVTTVAPVVNPYATGNAAPASSDGGGGGGSQAAAPVTQPGNIIVNVPPYPTVPPPSTPPRTSPPPTDQTPAPSVSTWGPPTAVSGIPGGYLVVNSTGGVAVTPQVKAALAAPPTVPIVRHPVAGVPVGYV